LACFGSGLIELGGAFVDLMHSYRWTPADAELSLTPAWEWALAYLLMGLIFLSAKWLLVED